MWSTKVLKWLVLCLAIAAGVKLLMESSHKRQGQRRESFIKDIGAFWSPYSPVEEKNSAHRDVVKAPSTEMKSLPEQTVQERNEIISGQVNTVQIPLKVVHLDLKGAAPKIQYLKEIFPLLASLGANGILLEYEDMFPYEGELEILKSPYAYSAADIEEIKSLAKLNKLLLIPLIQVFGHFEFVLKHEKYFHLREVASFPNSLNPFAPGSLDLVKDMLTQVLKRHPEAQWFHIGADEVHGLGQSIESQNWLNGNGNDIAKLFLNHVVSVGRFLTETRPGIKLLMWEDMLRNMNPATITESGLEKIAVPMIWNYIPKMNINAVENLIFKYEQAGFKAVWFASAFKGASEIDQIWTPLDHHLQNHLSWLKVASSMSKYPSIILQGLALTGWQRYEHHTVLCELFPVAIPSLAICLQSLKHGSFNENAKKEVNHILGCNILMEKNMCEGGGTFPGSDLYRLVHHVHGNLKSSIQSMLKHNHVRGSFSPYNRRYNFANPRNIAFFKDTLKAKLTEWERFALSLRKAMEAIYYEDTIEEWMEENVNTELNILRKMMSDAQRIIEHNGKPKALKPV